MLLPDMPVYTRHAEAKGWLAALLLGVVLLFFTAMAWGAGEASIAVVYPNIGEPYRQIFEEMIEGVEDKVGAPVARYPVQSGTDIPALKSSLSRQNTRVVIALGRQGMKAAAALNEVGVVVGGVLMVSESEARVLPGISLSPDPALLFARLKALMPAAKRVFVVYDPNINGWLMKLAKEAVRVQGMELVAYEATDLRSAVRIYQEIFSVADRHRDALWLPHDPTTVDERSVLPLVLQESWDHNLAVFSSSVGHVRRGALFSLYPDNVAMGKSLAGLAQGILASGDYGKPGLMPLRDVLIAVNLRTAQHLGLNLGQQQSFNMVFPEP